MESEPHPMSFRHALYPYHTRSAVTIITVSLAIPASFTACTIFPIRASTFLILHNKQEYGVLYYALLRPVDLNV